MNKTKVTSDNYDFNLPSHEDSADVTQLTDNWEKLDGILKELTDHGHNLNDDKLQGILSIAKGGTSADDWEEAQMNLKTISRLAKYYRPESNPDIDTLTNSVMLIPREYSKDCPVGGNFVYIMQLFYEDITATNNRTQIAFPYLSTKSSGTGMAIRSYNGAEWSEWQEIYGSQNKPTPADIGASPSGHGHALTDSVITGVLPITKGGTGASDVPNARKNLNFIGGSTTDKTTNAVYYTGTGNSGSGSIMYNFDTGARGSNVVFISGPSHKGFLTPWGGVMFQDKGSGLASATYEVFGGNAGSKASYANGYIMLRTDHEYINTQGGLYFYWCL